MIAPFGAANAEQDVGAAQAGEHLFEIAVGNALALGDLGHLEHASLAVDRGKLQQGHEPILRFGAEGHVIPGAFVGIVPGPCPCGGDYIGPDPDSVASFSTPIGLPWFTRSSP